MVIQGSVRAAKKEKQANNPALDDIVFIRR